MSADIALYTTLYDLYIYLIIFLFFYFRHYLFDPFDIYSLTIIIIASIIYI